MAARSIQPNQVVRNAYEYLLKASPDSSKFSNFRLEEITVNKDGNYEITLSYEVIGEFGFDRTRQYKRFMVDNKGKVVWMKIFNP